MEWISRKVDSLEKEVRQIKALVEEIHSEQTRSRLVADSGEEVFPGTAAKTLASGDVQLRSQVWMGTWGTVNNPTYEIWIGTVAHIWSVWLGIVSVWTLIIPLI